MTMMVFPNGKRKKNHHKILWSQSQLGRAQEKNKYLFKEDVAYHLHRALCLCPLGTQHVDNVCESTAGSFMWRKSFQVEKSGVN